MNELLNDTSKFERLEIPPNKYLNFLINSPDKSRSTNIPLEETNKNCVNNLFLDQSKIDNLPKQDLYDLLSAAAFFIVPRHLLLKINQQNAPL